MSSDESGAESDKHVSEPEEGTKHSNQSVIIALGFIIEYCLYTVYLEYRGQIAHEQK